MNDPAKDLKLLFDGNYVAPRYDVNFYHKLLADACWKLKTMGDTDEMRERADNFVTYLAHSGVPLHDLVKKYFKAFKLNYKFQGE